MNIFYLRIRVVFWCKEVVLGVSSFVDTCFRLEVSTRHTMRNFQEVTGFILIALVFITVQGIVSAMASPAFADGYYQEEVSENFSISSTEHYYYSEQFTDSPADQWTGSSPTDGPTTDAGINTICI